MVKERILRDNRMNVLQIERALMKSLDWFTHSGVMDPSDGSWGVAERIVTLEENSALSDIYDKFPNYTPGDGYSVIENRRPDCNFETALLFSLAGSYFGEEKYAGISRNIVRYLFRRSGTRHHRYLEQMPGIWRWCTPFTGESYWVDDNAWNSAVSLILASADRELEKELNLVEAGLATARTLAEITTDVLDGTDRFNGIPLGGRNLAPHFLGLAIMSLACAYSVTDESLYREIACRYIDRIAPDQAELSTSDRAYLLFGAAVCAAVFGDPSMLGVARSSADRLVAIMGEEGNIPSEHSETPSGKDLVDLIYTQNWATLGLGCLLTLDPDEKYRQAYAKSLSLLISIQDDSPEPHLSGCWRGLFDLSSGTWGGGDKYEGGKSSIYSGWTNAPISTILVLELEKRSFTDLLKSI